MIILLLFFTGFRV
jgi:hypothetical protein